MPHLEYLASRWTQGCHNASQLYQELFQRGYRGCLSQVRAAVHAWRARPAPSPCRPSLARVLLQPASRLTELERKELERFLEANPLFAHGYQLKERFQTLLTQRDVTALDQWIADAETSALPPFQAVAQGFRHDYEPIKAALSLPWNTGPCEGQICRVKLIKRLGYGRAKLDLLRQRILHRIATPMKLVGRCCQSQQAVAA
jgi:transposase